jgi:hypothetical protein
LRRLASAATFLYQDGNRYWYSTQATVSKLAEDRAEQLSREPDKVAQEIERRLRADLRQKGDFVRIHPLPQSSQDVTDDVEAGLVVLGVDHTYSKDPGNAAQAAAQSILGSRGNTPRLFQNALVFLAPDKTRLQDLDEATRKFLAWNDILGEQKELNLDPQQVKQAESQVATANSTVNGRIPETYQWLLVPVQEKPQSDISWQAVRLSGQDALAVRASKKLRSDEFLLTSFAGTRLRMELDRIPLWRGDHVSIAQLVDDFARYMYLPRLQDPSVLLEAVRNGVSLLTWEQETFAYADSFDESTGRYRGLRSGERLSLLDPHSPAVLVKSDVARKQMAADAVVEAPSGAAPAGPVGASPTGTGAQPGAPTAPAAKILRRFHGSVQLDPGRVGRDAGRIAEEVLSHLTGLVGARARVTLEINVEVPDGIPEDKVRIVNENANALRFEGHNFEEE